MCERADIKLVIITEGMQLRISYNHNFVQVKLCPSVYTLVTYFILEMAKEET